MDLLMIVVVVVVVVLVLLVVVMILDSNNLADFDIVHLLLLSRCIALPFVAACSH